MLSVTTPLTIVTVFTETVRFQPKASLVRIPDMQIQHNYLFPTKCLTFYVQFCIMNIDYNSML